VPSLGKFSPRIAAKDTMVINFGIKMQVMGLQNHFSKLAFNRHQTNPLLSLSKQQAAWKNQMPQSELKISADFLAIKC
jgi:hypothetical protein